jgi:MFS family permease
MSRVATDTWQGRLPFFYGWVVVVIALFTTFFGIGLTWAASIFAIPMKEDLGWGNSAFFFALSLRGWTGIVVAPIVGPYMDRRNGIRLLALAGGLLNVASLVLIGVVQSELQFVVLFGVVGGVAQALQMGATVIIPKWFIRRRGIAVSLASAGGGLAAFVLPPILVGIDSALGWRAGWLILALLAFLFSAFPVTLLRREPEDVGLLPDGDGLRATEATRPPPREEPSFTRAEAMHTRTFWILMVGVAFGAMAANGLPANLTNLFVDRGLELDTAATALVFYGVASIGAKFFWGWLANKYDLRSVLLLLTAYGAVAVPVIVLVPDAVGSPALMYGALVGFYVGAYIPLHFLVWAAYFGRAHVGAISGVGRPLGAMTLAGGPFIIALARDASGTYTTGLLLAAAGIAAAFICLYFVQPPRKGSSAGVDIREQAQGVPGVP